MAEYPVYGAGEAFIAEVESPERSRTLRALRTHIAQRIADGVAARDLSALSRQLRDIEKELAALGDEAEGAGASQEDELARRRQAVLSAAGVERTAKGR
jgi:hypothetical protein